LAIADLSGESALAIEPEGDEPEGGKAMRQRIA
jgi:hypothetical protein